MIEKDALFWNRTAGEYAASPIKDQAGFEKTLARTRDLIVPGDRVLEIGCGTGTVALLMADSAISYLATDLSTVMISIAQEKLEVSRKNGMCSELEFRHGTADSLVCECKRYDVVLGFNYLHLVRDLTSELKHVHSLLRTGGLFISKTPCIGEMNQLIRFAIPIMRLVGKAPSVVNPLTAKSLVKMITEAGFEVLGTERHGTEKIDFRPFIVARAK